MGWRFRCSPNPEVSTDARSKAALRRAEAYRRRVYPGFPVKSYPDMQQQFKMGGAMEHSLRVFVDSVEIF